MKLIRSAGTIVKAHRRAYVVLNLIYYGLMAAGMIYAAFDPASQRTLQEAVGSLMPTEPLPEVSVGVEFLRAASIIFVLNLVGASLLYITFPSLIIPFSGLLPAASRALLWGIFFSPTTPGLTAELLPHLPVLIVEGQAYVLAMLAAYVQGKAFLRPKSVNAQTHRQGYWIGVKHSVRIYLLVAILLLVGATYEAVETLFVRGAA